MCVYIKCIKRYLKKTYEFKELSETQEQLEESENRVEMM